MASCPTSWSAPRSARWSAAVYAVGKLDAFEEWARGLTTRGVLGYLDVSLGGSGLIGGDRLAARLEQTLGDTMIEDLPKRYACIATELGTGHEIWLTRGRVVDAAARLLRAARHVHAGAPRRPLAGRRRAGQSGAGLGRARARRPARDRGQPEFRHARPRRHDRQTTAPTRTMLESWTRSARARKALRRIPQPEYLLKRQLIGDRAQPEHREHHDRRFQHHAGSYHALAPRRRSARRPDRAAHAARSGCSISTAPRKRSRSARRPRKRSIADDRPRRSQPSDLTDSTGSAVWM